MVLCKKKYGTVEKPMILYRRLWNYEDYETFISYGKNYGSKP